MLKSPIPEESSDFLFPNLVINPGLEMFTSLKESDQSLTSKTGKFPNNGRPNIKVLARAGALQGMWRETISGQSLGAEPGWWEPCEQTERSWTFTAPSSCLRMKKPQLRVLRPQDNIYFSGNLISHSHNARESLGGVSYLVCVIHYAAINSGTAQTQTAMKVGTDITTLEILHYS